MPRMDRRPHARLLRLARSADPDEVHEGNPRASVFSAIFAIFVVPASPSAAVETVAFALAQDRTSTFFEFACHEGNLLSMRVDARRRALADR